MFFYKVDEEIQLKLIMPSDAEELFALIDRSRPYLREWLGWVDATKTVEDTRQFAEMNLKKFAEQTCLDTAIIYNGKFVGKISLNSIDWAKKTASVGYMLDENFQGDGIMTRAAKGILDIAFTHYGLQKVEVHVATGNEKSCNIPERLGFAQEGILRRAEWLYDHYVDQIVYGLLAEEWLESEEEKNPQ